MKSFSTVNFQKPTVAPGSLFRVGKILIYVNTDYYKITHCKVLRYQLSESERLTCMSFTPLKPTLKQHVNSWSTMKFKKILEQMFLMVKCLVTTAPIIHFTTF